MPIYRRFLQLSEPLTEVLPVGGLFFFMAKDLPYFKFEPAEWQSGDIVFEELETQGLFINICALYWQKSGKLKIEDIEKRWQKPTALNSLLGRFIFASDGIVSIRFLDEQFEERRRKSKTNSKNGSLGGRPSNKDKKPTALNSLTETQAKKSNIEKKREEKNINTTSVVLHPLIEWLRIECPRVCAMDFPLTHEQAERIFHDFTNKTLVKGVFLAMQNRKSLLKDYTSANLTFRKWITKESDGVIGQQQASSSRPVIKTIENK